MSRPWPAKTYQKAGVRWLVSHGCAALFDDPGLGKTSTMLTAFSTLKSKGIVNKMLVIAPLRPAYSTWPKEAQKWDHLSNLKVVVLHGPYKAALLKERADVYVINPEGLPWLFRQRLPKGWLDVLCIDESTRFKHTDTTRFRTLRPFLGQFKRRYILTGSPSPNGYVDLFGQIYVMDLGRALGQYITHYRSKYFDSSGYGGFTYKIKPGSQEEIQRLIAPMVLRRSAEECLDLPPLVGACGKGEPLVTKVELPPAAMKTYKRMETLLLAELDAEVVVAANASVAAGKCRQIANGGLYGIPGLAEDDRTIHNIHEEKIEATRDLVEEMSGVPCLIAYEYAHDLIRLQKAFPKAPYIGGGVSPKRFEEIEVLWNMGALPVLLAQPQSVAHGLNLQATRANVIWHSLTWDLELYEQFIRRVWRQGQQHRVHVHHIVAEGTIDEKILLMLQKKDKVQQNLLRALRAAYKEAA